MKLTTKIAEQNDINTIYQLNIELINKYENLDDINYLQVLDWIYNKITNFISDYKKIIIDQEIVGFYHFYYKKEMAMFELDDFYILDNYQKQGIGTNILNTLIKNASKPIFLYVFIKNTKAIKFYEKLGFKIVKKVKNSRYIMKKSI